MSAIRRMRVTVDGKPFEVVVEMLDSAGEAVGKTAAAPVAGAVVETASSAPVARPVAGNGAVPSPMSGRVITVHVTVGSQVQAGEPLITLEAMKMNTVISAPHSGQVRAVHVEVGAGVEEGQPLVTVQ